MTFRDCFRANHVAVSNLTQGEDLLCFHSPLSRRTRTACRGRKCWREARCLFPRMLPVSAFQCGYSQHHSYNDKEKSGLPAGGTCRLLKRNIQTLCPVRHPIKRRAGACGCCCSCMLSGSSSHRWHGCPQWHDRWQLGFGHRSCAERELPLAAALQHSRQSRTH